MNFASNSKSVKGLWRLTGVALAALLLAACSNDPADPADTDGNEGSSGGDFDLIIDTTSLQLTEGDGNGLSIPVSIVRRNGHSNPVQLDIRGLTEADVKLVTSRFSPSTPLTEGTDSSTMTLKLDIDDRPISPQTRNFVVTASDGVSRADQPLSITALPTAAPDVYLLIGQSNMIGFSGDGTRQSGVGGPDEPNPRIKQLNVTKNDGTGMFPNPSDFTSEQANVVPPGIVMAEDPLHIPLDPNNTGKDLSYIGLGLSFAKRALLNTTAEIILVPAAWSGSSFCKSEGDPPDPQGNWNAEPPSNENLGNTLLFDRAVTRTNLALSSTGGILRGILWHQGENDAKDRCAPLYQENMIKLVQGLRTRIQPDLRGQSLRQPDSNIPFVVGTMSRGADERGDLTEFLPAKETVDMVHNMLPDLVSYAGLSDHDDLVPDNGYPCGNSNCIHFGPGALREMGNRYYDAMLRALLSPLNENP